MADRGEMSFWDHLEELRGTILRSLAAIAIVAVVVFCFKKLVFDGLILAPARDDFFIYKWLHMEPKIDLVNLELSAQFFIHLKTSVVLGFILAFPYVCWEIWKFIAPALYENEKEAAKKAFLIAGVLFYFGLFVGYTLVLPITLNFFQNYTVSSQVHNTISLNSYISTFTSMVLAFGVVFEFPAVISLLCRLGVVDPSSLKKYRRHAVVVAMIIGAIITPADPFSMIVAALPLYLLYELSILLCAGKKEVKGDLVR